MRNGILLGAILMGLSLGVAQEQPKFEVASIKPAETSPMGGLRVSVAMQPGGRLSMKNVSASFLIQQAYGVRQFQVTGGPSWVGSDLYDISAKPEEGQEIDRKKIGLMIQSLLADRFKLTCHRETKEMPVYALVVAKGGPKLKESEAGPMRAGQVRMGRGLIEGQGMSIAMLIEQLGQALGRQVIDKTGLTGNYDIKLEWTPDVGQGGMPGAAPAPPEGASPETTGPTLITALQEQLGLKLENQKGPVDVLVLDHIEKPSEN